MAEERDVQVHLTPRTPAPMIWRGGSPWSLTCCAPRPPSFTLWSPDVRGAAVPKWREARELADSLRAGRVLLGGERDGKPLRGFDVGNSPREYTTARCRGAVLVLTTSNGTRALITAPRRPTASWSPRSSITAPSANKCARNASDPYRVAGDDGSVALEDALLAGALVDFLSDLGAARLNDGARLAWDAFAQHGRVLEGALAVTRGRRAARSLGYEEDIAAAARRSVRARSGVALRSPRVEAATVGIVTSHWRK